MRNTWLQEQLTAISDEKYQFIIDEAVKYIEQLEDDNESLQVALEGNIWSPKNGTKSREVSQGVLVLLLCFYFSYSNVSFKKQIISCCAAFAVSG